MLLTPFIQQLYTYYQIIENAYSFNQLLSLFFLFSFMGWMLETLYRSFSQKRFFNPGFLKGPAVPLYGIAGVFIMITIVFTHEEAILVRLLIYFSAITAMEFVTGEVMLRLFKRRYWDYTNNVLNIRGHVCLPFSIAWAVLSLVFEKTIYPLSIVLVGYVDDQHLMLLNGAGILILQVDFIYSTGIWRSDQRAALNKTLGGWQRRMLPCLSIQHLLSTTHELKRHWTYLRGSSQRLIQDRHKRKR